MHLLLEGLVGLDPDSDDNLSIKNMKKQGSSVTTGNESKWSKKLHEIPRQKNDFGETREDSNERFLVRNARMYQSRRDRR